MIKWLQKLAVEKRGRQLAIQDKLVDLETKMNQLNRDMTLSSMVTEIAAKEILTIKAILNRNGLLDTVVELSDSDVKEIMKGPSDEQH